MTYQEQKNYLWKLDNYTGKITSDISRETGNAWEAIIEGGNIRQCLVTAQGNAQALANKLQDAIKVFNKEDSRV